jgi:predicted ArsR family transcriptional regulator
VNLPQPSDPKRRVITYLKRSGATSTQAVAQTLEVTDVAARQHLTDLEQQGLVSRSTAPPEGRGRPGVLWSLTPLAQDLFPDRHDALTLDLIASIRDSLGEDSLTRVIQARTQRQLETLRKSIDLQAPLRERLEALARERTAEGYMAEVVEEPSGGFLLVEHHCPICDAAQECQMFCSTELTLFQDALGPDVSVKRESHLLSGDERCVYSVKTRPQKPD